MNSSRISVQEFLLIIVGLSVSGLLISAASLVIALVKSPLAASTINGVLVEPVAKWQTWALLFEVCSCAVVGFRYLHGNIRSLEAMDGIITACPVASDRIRLKKRFWLFSAGSLLQAFVYAFACALFSVQYSFFVALGVVFLIDVVFTSLAGFGNVAITDPGTERAWDPIEDTHKKWAALSTLQVLAVAVICTIWYIQKEGFESSAQVALGSALVTCTCLDYYFDRKFYFAE